MLWRAKNADFVLLTSFSLFTFPLRLFVSLAHALWRVTHTLSINIQRRRATFQQLFNGSHTLGILGRSNHRRSLLIKHCALLHKMPFPVPHNPLVHNGIETVARSYEISRQLLAIATGSRTGHTPLRFKNKPRKHLIGLNVLKLLYGIVIRRTFTATDAQNTAKSYQQKRFFHNQFSFLR